MVDKQGFVTIWIWIWKKWKNLLQKQPVGVFYRKAAPKNFAKFTWKHFVRVSFLNKAAGLRSPTLLKKRFWHKSFSCKFCQVFKNTFFIEHPRATISVHNYALEFKLVFWLLLVEIGIGFTWNSFVIKIHKCPQKMKFTSQIICEMVKSLEKVVILRYFKDGARVTQVSHSRY